MGGTAAGSGVDVLLTGMTADYLGGIYFVEP
jgi:hypothetical protein